MIIDPPLQQQLWSNKHNMNPQLIILFKKIEIIYIELQQLEKIENTIFIFELTIDLHLQQQEWQQLQSNKQKVNLQSKNCSNILKLGVITLKNIESNWKMQ